MEEIRKLEEDIKKPSEVVKDKKGLFEQLVKHKWKIFIAQYLEYANDFIGRDWALLKKYTYYIILLNLVTENEDLERKQQIQLDHAMKDNEYLFLNILYNIKEKFESFLLYDNKQKGFRAVLTENDKLKLQEKAKTLLVFIENYTNARGICIHSVVKFENTFPTKTLNLCEFSFNLGDEVNVEVSKKTELPFDNETLIKILKEIVKFRNYIVELAYNFDYSKIEDNIKKSGGKFIIGF